MKIRNTTDHITGSQFEVICFLFSHLLVVASSSFVEDKGQVLENLLTEIHRGNFCPLIPPDLTTPDKENMTFDLDLDCLSPIHQVGSPFKLGETLPPIASVETLNDFTLVNQENQQDVTGQWLTLHFCFFKV